MSDMFIKRQNAIKIEVIKKQIINSIIANRNQQALQIAEYRKQQALKVAANRNQQEALKVAGAVCKKVDNLIKCEYVPVDYYCKCVEDEIVLTKID